MARGRKKATPMSERDAGEKAASSDEMSELLADAEPMEGVEEVEATAVPSGPIARSDRETPVEPAKARKADLKALAPKKDRPKSPRERTKKTEETAHERMLSQGIFAGDTSKIEPVEVFRVMRGGRVMLRGRIHHLKEGAHVTRITHPLEDLRRQGIELSLVGRK